jgi:O-antigen/teichoic acid export membrane protein
MNESSLQVGETRPRLVTGLATIFDQGVVSLGTFAVHILLARGLSESDYGLFALMLLSILFLNQAHSALLLQPLAVRSGSLSSRDLRPLARSAVVGTLAYSLPCGLILTVLAAAVGRVDLAPFLIGLGCAWQLQESQRRILLCADNRLHPIPGDALRYLGQAIGVLLLVKLGGLGLESVFACLLGFAFVGAVVQWIQILYLTDPGGGSVGLRELWLLGRWLLLAGAAISLSMQLIFWLLYSFGGTDSLARYQALASLLGLSHPVFVGLGNYLLPALARWHAESGSLRTALARTQPFRFLGLILLVPAWCVCLIWPEAVLTLFYGVDSPYVALVFELRLFVFMMAGAYYASLIAPLLIGLSLKEGVAVSQAAGFVSCLLVAPPLIWLGGLSGAILAAAALNGVRVGVAYLALRRASGDG